jgi:hypothetical protein
MCSAALDICCGSLAPIAGGGGTSASMNDLIGSASLMRASCGASFAARLNNTFRITRSARWNAQRQERRHVLYENNPALRKQPRRSPFIRGCRSLAKKFSLIPVASERARGTRPSTRRCGLLLGGSGRAQETKKTISVRRLFTQQVIINFVVVAILIAVGAFLFFKLCEEENPQFTGVRFIASNR